MNLIRVLSVLALAIVMNNASSFAEIFGVEETLIENAKQVPSQKSLGYEGSWSCGPNSLARFFYLNNIKDFSCKEQKDYEHFVTNCPRSCGQPATKIGYAACAIFLTTSVASIYFADGYDDYFCGLVEGACAFAPFAIEAFNKWRGVGKVGPTPRWLAGYGNVFLKQNGAPEKVKVEQLQDENKLIDLIKGELRRGKPVLTLINFGPLAWHYVNIVRFENRDFIYLDTYQDMHPSEYRFSQRELISYMDFEKNTTTRKIKGLLKYAGWPLGVDIDRFNVLVLEINESIASNPDKKQE